ncbi:hypothetical protein [Breznakiella homolactica]|uniref:Transmembrane protein n=1 Tax=Breznakiella homolactica TaxID=2798577 RepID=A0A7T7XJU1_9SPIR|nr:hypothetical protein [Breznakiella homolactica]QQO07542.1 hypothetical protein JFL75_11340 [Breznakiella homolactica]
MNDLIPQKDYVPREVLARQGVTAVTGLIGGGALLIVKALPSVVGIVAGAVVGVVGIGALLSKDPGDRKAGLVITAAGALGILSKIPIFSGIAGGLLTVGVVGLLGIGIWNGIKFIRGLKART